MAESLTNQTSGQGNTPATAQEIAEVIQEFEQYRSRLVEDMTAAAKKAKLSKSKLMSRLEPELAQLDSTLDALRQQHAALVESN